MQKEHLLLASMMGHSRSVMEGPSSGAARGNNGGGYRRFQAIRVEGAVEAPVTKLLR